MQQFQSRSTASASMARLAQTGLLSWVMTDLDPRFVHSHALDTNWHARQCSTDSLAWPPSLLCHAAEVSSSFVVCQPRRQASSSSLIVHLAQPQRRSGCKMGRGHKAQCGKGQRANFIALPVASHVLTESACAPCPGARPMQHQSFL